VLPPKRKELWEGMEENRRITLGMVAETGTSKVIRKMLKENTGNLPPHPADDTVLAIRETSRSREGMAEAPEVAHPRGSLGKEEILRLAVQAREATRASLEMLAGADPRSAEFPHPFFGSMNLYEWPHRIIREHERQHHPQIEKILRSLGK